MPTLKLPDVDLHYEVHGNGPETIIFSHGLLFDGRMFAKQVEAFSDQFRCVTFDFRGQGQTSVADGGYDMDTLTQDAIALMEHLDCAPCHFMGLSMGGFIGLRLAIRRPELLRSLVLMESTADPEPNRTKYRILNFVARHFGLGVVSSRVMPIMFGQKFLHDAQRAEEKAVLRKQIIANDRVGITRAVQGVVDREGVYDQLPQIDTPTLIIVGDQDVATVPEKSERMHAAISGSKLVIVEGAGHSSTIEEPVAINAAIADFLNSLS